MDENPAIAQNPRFSALFGELRCGQRSKRAVPGSPARIHQEDQSNMPAPPNTSSHTQQTNGPTAGPSTIYAQSHTPVSFSHFHPPGPNGSGPPPSWSQPHSTYYGQFYLPLICRCPTANIQLKRHNKFTAGQWAFIYLFIK